MPWTLRIAAIGAIVQVDGGALTAAQRNLVTAAWRDAVADDMGRVDAVVTPLLGVDDAAMLADLSQRVTLAAIDARRGEVWMLHAAGLALDDGRVVALVGPSGRGKTTAAMTLGRAFGYVSDETVAIDLAGRVWPYRKPLSVIDDPAAPKHQRTPTDAGMRALPDAPLQLAAVVLLDRRSDAPEEPVIEEVDLGDALADLVEQTSYLPSLETPLQLLAGHLARVGGVQRVIYREASSLVDVLPALARGPAVAPAGVPAGALAGVPAGALAGTPAGMPAGALVGTHVGAPAGTASLGAVPPDEDAPSLAPDVPGYFRTPTEDAVALVDPDRIAILQVDAEGAGTVRVLAGVAPALWRAARGASVDQLVAAAVDAYGTPGSARDAAVLVGAALAQLVEAGLIEHRLPRWRIESTVPWVDSGDRVVLLPPSGDGLARALDPSGTIIWRELYERGPIAVDALADAVAEVAGVSTDDVMPTLPPFLGELADVGVARLA